MRRSPKITLVISTILIVLASSPAAARSLSSDVEHASQPIGWRSLWVAEPSSTGEVAQQVRLPLLAESSSQRSRPPAIGTIPLELIRRQIISPEIDLEHLSTDGRTLRISGPIACTQGEHLSIRATITQQATGALAEGRWSGTCTGEVQSWRIRRLVAHSAESFVAGEFQACGLATTTRRGRRTDAHQWCETARLRGQ